jgi:hypothetical protein
MPALEFIALGVPLVLTYLFYVFIIMDAVNITSFGIAITGSLVLILIVQIMIFKYQKLRIRVNVWLLALILILISMGFTSDLITRKYNNPGYSEFYLQSLNVNESDVQVELKISNNYPIPVSYWFQNQSLTINLKPGESWSTELSTHIQETPMSFKVTEILSNHQVADYTLALFIKD